MSETQVNGELGKTLWQAQALEAPRISLELVRHHVDKLNGDWREQKLLMYFALAVMACAVPFGFFRDPTSNVFRVGSILAIIGAIYVTLEVRRRGGQLDSSIDGGVLRTLDAYRAELERRRDYYLDSWRWSLWPMIPSLVVFLVGGALYGTSQRSIGSHIAMGLFAVVGTSVAVWDHRRKGRAFQRELDAFETLTRH
jgi:hypothetical protein